MGWGMEEHANSSATASTAVMFLFLPLIACWLLPNARASGASTTTTQPAPPTFAMLPTPPTVPSHMQLDLLHWQVVWRYQDFARTRLARTDGAIALSLGSSAGAPVRLVDTFTSDGVPGGRRGAWDCWVADGQDRLAWAGQAGWLAGWWASRLAGWLARSVLQ